LVFPKCSYQTHLPKNGEQSPPKKSLKKHSGFWKDSNNQREFMNSLAQEFNIDPSKAEQWYEIRVRDVLERQGAPLLTHFNNSLYLALQTIYPELEIYPWLFRHSHLSSSFWNEDENVLGYLRWLAKELKMENGDEFKRLSSDQLKRMPCGSTLLHKHTLKQLILKMVEEKKFGDSKVSHNHRKAQWSLFQATKELFGKLELDISSDPLSTQRRQELCQVKFAEVVSTDKSPVPFWD
jgi:Mg2+ and Co2+ transporter CorA